MSTHTSEELMDYLKELNKQCREKKSCFFTVLDGYFAFEERLSELFDEQIDVQAQQILQELAHSGRLVTPPSMVMCAEVSELAEWCGHSIGQPYYDPLYSNPMIVKMVSEEIFLPKLEEIGEMYGVRKYLGFTRDSINDVADELDCKMSLFTCLNYLLINGIIHWVTRSHGVISDPDVKHMILSSNPDEVADLTDEESIKLKAQYGGLSPNDPFAGRTVEELAELEEQARKKYHLYHPL